MKKILVSSDLNISIASGSYDLTYDFEREAVLAIENDDSFSEELTRKIRALGIPLIGNPRLNKIEQHLVLNRYGVPHPETFYDFKDLKPLFNNIDLLNAYVDLDEFVVKPIRGARGIGVKKITKKDYVKCVFDSDHIKEVFEKENEFLEKHNSDVSASYISSHFGTCLIQEPIDVDREFRLLMFKGSKNIAYERIKEEGQFCGNLSHGSKPIDVSQKDFEKYIEPITVFFEKIMRDMLYPWLSIDVYVDKNGSIGVFEFQMEFAYDGFDHKLVRESMVRCLDGLTEKI